MKNPERKSQDRPLPGCGDCNLSAQPSVSCKAGDDLRFFAPDLRILTMYLPIVVLACIFTIYVLDQPIANYCKSLNRNILVLFRFLSRLGHCTWYLAIPFLLYFTFKCLYKRKIYSNQALFAFLSVAISGILADIAKFIFGRYRPDVFFMKNLYGFSFFEYDYSATSLPSGHATCVTAFVLSLYSLYPKYKYIYTIFALPIIVSRVIIGAHFLTDVIVGACLAVVITTYLEFIFKNKGVELVDLSD